MFHPAAHGLQAAQPSPVTMHGERTECVVTEWNERGYGFVLAADGRRAYVHVSAFGGGNLTPGEPVSAIIVEDTQTPGKWQARALQRGPLGEDGTITDWRQEGYGFLSMDDGRRVYIHHSSFGGGDLYVGLRLRVLTKPDPRNPGKWAVASVVADLQGSGQPMPEVPAERATVQEWDTRGYGFVQTEDGRRVYVHHSAFGSGNLIVGEHVKVVVAPDQRNPGKLMAVMLARDGDHTTPGVEPATLPDASAPFSVAPGMQGAGAPVQEWFSGTVAEWHEERGYGFIELQDGRRLYVHHTAFGGGSLAEGALCEAVAAPDKVNPGKWSAVSVRGDAVLPRTTSNGELEAKRQRFS